MTSPASHQMNVLQIPIMVSCVSDLPVDSFVVPGAHAECPIALGRVLGASRGQHSDYRLCSRTGIRSRFHEVACAERRDCDALIVGWIRDGGIEGGASISHSIARHCTIHQTDLHA
jgi:hypothetical protein